MDLYINLILAWVSVGLGVLCSIIWVLRLIHKKRRSRQKNGLYRANRALRRSHKWLGIAMVITGCIHGLLSSDRLIGWNLGTLCWVLCILLGLTYLFRKGLRRPSWMVWHRILVIAVICSATVHVIQTGIKIDDVLWKKEGSAKRETNEMADGYDRATPGPTADWDNAAQATPTMPVTPTTPTTPTESPAPTGWRDGVYIGEGTGYNPGLRVRVTIEAGEIAAIEVIAHDEEDEHHWEPAVKMIPGRIVDAQSTDVDIVTGSTKTSGGIIEAVEDALDQAYR